jgi:hypothetical protein
MEYHFENIPGAITTMFIHVNDHGVGMDVKPFITTTYKYSPKITLFFMDW